MAKELNPFALAQQMTAKLTEAGYRVTVDTIGDTRTGSLLVNFENIEYQGQVSVRVLGGQLSLTPLQETRPDAG